MKSLMNFALCAGVLLASTSAFAQTAPANASVDLGVLTNCNNVALSSPITRCEIRSVSAGVFGSEGYNLLTLKIKYADNAGSAGGTGYTLLLQACDEGFTSADCTDTADWYTVAGETYAAGTLTIAPGTITRSYDSGSSDLLMWSVGINYKRLSVATVTGTGTPGANDKITVSARLSRSGAF